MNASRAPKANLEISSETDGDVALVRLRGPIDERFESFRSPSVPTLVIDVSGLVRITSYGVRQWLLAQDALPATVTTVYFVGCPTFFVDQLNMVLNFGGRGRVLSAAAPFSCPSCKLECTLVMDILANGKRIASGQLEQQICPRCKGQLELDELPESYFSFVRSLGATSLNPSAARILGKHGLYAGAGTPAPANEAMPRLIKLVHDRVTYFQISGPMDRSFRSRPLLEGSEGEIVLDVREITTVTPEGLDEWNRLLGKLAEQVPSVTLVDLGAPLLAEVATRRLVLGRAALYSVLAPYQCERCGRRAAETVVVAVATRPISAPERTCANCGGVERFAGPAGYFAPIERTGTCAVPAATRDVIERRQDLVSRALVEQQASVAVVSASAPRTDGILGKYTILRTISAGGMAEVFLAVQKGIGGFEKLVALKRIRRSMLERKHLAVEMFLNEAKIAASINHPNIVQIFDVGEEQGLLYLAMEYVRGKDLRAVLRRLREIGRSFALGDALYILQQVALALHHAYTAKDLAGRQLKVVHRDVSPHNVLLGYDGAVKLADFGVALATSTRAADATLSGKFCYMSPEQTRGTALDQRSDMFSLGAVFYEICSGKRPFLRSNAFETLNAVRDGRFATLSKIDAAIPRPIEELCSRMLAHNAADRPADGREVARTAEEIAKKLGYEMRIERVAQALLALFPDPSGRHGGADPVSQALDSTALDGAGSDSLEIGTEDTTPISQSVELELGAARSSGAGEPVPTRREKPAVGGEGASADPVVLRPAPGGSRAARRAGPDESTASLVGAPVPTAATPRALQALDGRKVAAFLKPNGGSAGRRVLGALLLLVAFAALGLAVWWFR